jgi:hypothetical protein
LHDLAPSEKDRAKDAHSVATADYFWVWIRVISGAAIIRIKTTAIASALISPSEVLEADS